MFLIYFLVYLLINGCNGIGRLCTQSNDCPNGEKCYIGRCECDQQELLDNGRCTLNQGRCRNGEKVYYNGNCYFITKIGQNCVTNYQCYGDSVCMGSSCICPQGTTQNNDACISSGGNCQLGEVLVNNMCIARAPPGQTCQDSLQCMDGSTCSPQMQRCVCPSGMFQIRNRCLKLSSTDPCDQTTSVAVNGQCLQRSIPGGVCTSTIQCLSNSQCTNRYCQCPSGTQNFQQYCIQSTNNCLANQVMVNNQCYDTVPLGSYCMVNEQCTTNLAECSYTATCQCIRGMQQVNGMCQQSTQNPCNIGQVMVNGNCVDRMAPGMNCIANEQCLDNSVCVNGACNCPQGMFNLNGYCVKNGISANCPDRNIFINGQCLPLRPPGYSCTNNEQCLAGSSCIKDTCNCILGYINFKQYCIKDQNSQCNPNQVLVNGQCYDMAQIGQNCMMNEQCQGGSTCVSNYCRCPPGSTQNGNTCSNNQCWSDQVLVNGVCQDKASIGESCTYNEQCIGGSYCVASICTCPPGTIVLNNVCKYNGNCQSTQVLINGLCYEIKNVGQSCQYMEQCQSGSSCTMGTCSCPLGTNLIDNWCIGNGQCRIDQFPLNGLCYYKVKYGQFCYVNQQCPRNVSCIQNWCQCLSGAVNSGGACVSNTNCKPYQVLVNNVCMETVSVGMNCLADSQCIALAICTNDLQQGQKTCQCKSGTLFTGSGCTVTSSEICPPSTVYISTGNCKKLVAIGQYCQHTAQCMGFSACIQSTCKCPTGFESINNVCRKH